VALRAACASTAFDAVAVYEPGISVNGSIPVDWTDRARLEVSAGANFEAFIMPQAISEHTEAGRLDGRLADYRDIAAATLIMRGKGRGTSRQAAVLSRLAETIPHSETMTFPGLDHFAPEKKPGQIADAVLRFFAAHAQPGAAMGEMPEIEERP
jgi:pimeloyl-ACP methyl ester carboxylesterase